MLVQHPPNLVLPSQNVVSMTGKIMISVVWGRHTVEGRTFAFGTSVLNNTLGDNAAVLITEGLSHPETPLGGSLGGSLGIPLAGIGRLRIRCLGGNPIEGSNMFLFFLHWKLQDRSLGLPQIS